MRKILGARWFTNNDGLIGIVAARTSEHAPEKGEWKAYIGIGHGYNQEADQQHIADLGSALQPEEAAAFFPHLEISKYKDYQAPASEPPMGTLARDALGYSPANPWLSELFAQQRRWIAEGQPEKKDAQG